MKVRLVVGSFLVLAGCGGKKGTIELDLVVPAIQDPFMGGNRIEIIAGPHSASATLTEVNGVPHYSISFDQKPPKSAYNLVVEVFDAGSNIIAYGETPLITLGAVNQGPFGVWLGIPGTIATSKSALAAGVTGLAGCGVTGLGAVLAGGESIDANSMPIAVTTTYVYDAFTSAIIDTAALTTARLGAVALPAAAKGIVFGGSSTYSPLTSLATAEVFDPTSGGAGQWIPAPGSATAQAYPSLAILADGTGLATGGFLADGVTLSNAATAITAGGSIMIGSTTTMTSARVHHAAAWMTLGGSAKGALLVGGLPAMRVLNSTIAEEYVNGTFVAIADSAIVPTTGTPIPNLWNATATTLGAGAGVFIAGGGVDGGAATSSAYYVTFNQSTNAFVVTNFTSLGIAARKNHTATLVGDDLLLCGGIGPDGVALRTCDVIATNPAISFARTVSGLVARQNHVAVALETGPVVFAGGDDGAGTLLKTVDIYTPTMAEETIVNQQNGAVIGAGTADGGTH